MSLSIQILKAEDICRKRSIKQNKMLSQNSIKVIASLIAITNCCLCVQGSLFGRWFFRDDLEPTKETIFENNQVDSVNIKHQDNEESDKLNALYSKYWRQLENSGQNSDHSEIIKMLDSELSPYLNVTNYPGELCQRECKRDEKRICYFEFTLELYQAMGVACGKCKNGVEADCNHPQCIVGDGFEKGVMSINRQIPGPAIQVCKDDLVIVDVHNRADGTAATLHWHGILMKNTPFMDGVPFVTQCPIAYANSFRYMYNATEPGTQFYHSHSGHHKANGQYGVLTVRQPKDMEPLSVLYDYDLPEHHIFISDWMHSYAEDSFPGVPKRRILPDSVLINGRGIYTDPETLERAVKIKPTIYYVTRGKRYLFRLINGVSHACPFSLQIENHNFTIVSSDSYTVLPHTFDNLVSNSGERYDFVLEATQSVGDYWIHVRAMGLCGSDKAIESYALIRYVDQNFHDNKEYLAALESKPVPSFPNYHELLLSRKVLNHPNATCWDGESNQCVTELSAFEEDEELRFAVPDHKFFLAFNNYVIPNQELFKSGQYLHFGNFGKNLTQVGAINNITLVFPDTPPLTQPESLDESQFCDANNRPERCANTRFCQCVHLLKVKHNSIVELVILDESDTVSRFNHPFHLHGYSFMVTAMGQDPFGWPMTAERAEHLESKKSLPRDYFNTSPAFKDTVSIPSRGYVILRLRASNPGFWLMHCHYEWHSSIGMALVLQVGEVSEMVKTPSDFPKCGNYVPRVERTLDFSTLKTYLQNLFMTK